MSVSCDVGGAVTAMSTAGSKPEIHISPEAISAKNLEFFKAEDHESASVEITDVDTVHLVSH